MDCGYWRRPSPRMIPDRWMSVTDHAGHRARGNDTAGGRRPSASGSGDVCWECTTRDRGRGLRWARSTDADGEGDVRGLPGHGICTGPLDFATLIDGFVSSSDRPHDDGLSTPTAFSAEITQSICITYPSYPDIGFVSSSGVLSSAPSEHRIIGKLCASLGSFAGFTPAESSLAFVSSICIRHPCDPRP